ncbi:MAG: ribonuclease III [Clostridium sp.]|nr:ribonuclease III [Clostridium sp.]
MEESIALYSYIKEQFAEKEVDLRTYSPLTLAFIGDGVFDLVVRAYVVGRGNRPAHLLHKEKSAIVKAEAQARMADALYDSLTPKEQEIYRRGKNAKPANTAKNATLIDYHKATGLEALCGYLFMADETARLIELIRRGVESLSV